MSVSGLNHITLGVTDLERSIHFYKDVLGFKLKAQWADGAYLEAGTLWLCLTQQSQAIADRSEDYSHIGLSIDPDLFDQYSARILAIARKWKENSSEGKSLYFLDPDGHRLELHIGDLNSRLEHYRQIGRQDIRIYDEPHLT